MILAGCVNLLVLWLSIVILPVYLIRRMGKRVDRLQEIIARHELEWDRLKYKMSQSDATIIAWREFKNDMKKI